MKNVNFFIAGVGGQGTVLISNVLAEVGVQAGFDVKKTEVHGMAQRGGSVTTHVRWGDRVFSPVIARGEVDYLLAIEKLESLRYVEWLEPGGIALIGDAMIPPLTVSSGSDHYPTDAEILRVFSQVTNRCFIIPTQTIAQSLGNSKVHNVMLLGALAQVMQDVPADAWLKAVEERVPQKHLAINRQAFAAGRELALVAS